MKTFIWNREYEVLAANAETIEDARELLKPKLDQLLDPNLRRAIEESVQYNKEHTLEDTKKGYYKDDDWWERHIEYIRNTIIQEKYLLDKTPDIIIDENQAIIFGHMNE